MKLKPGDPAPSFQVTDILGKPRSLEDYRGKKLLLAFHRYANCPLCNLRMHELAKKRDFFAKTGLEVVAFFESPQTRTFKKFSERDMPFPIIADPERVIYQRYGVESSWGGFAVALVHPKAVLALARGFMPGPPDGDLALLPADFLIGPDLIIKQCYYASNITEHMPLAQIEAFAAV